MSFIHGAAVTAVLAFVSVPLAYAQGQPDQPVTVRQGLLAEIEKQLPPDDVPPIVKFTPSIRLKSFDLNLSAMVSRMAGPEFNPGRPTDAACGMQRFQMKLFKDDQPVNEFSVLLDPQASSSSAVASYVVARTEVLQVDADGSPRSYHPEDPLARKTCNLQPGPSGGFIADKVCAIDKLGNADIFVFRGGVKLKTAEMEEPWLKLWPKIKAGTIKPIPASQIPEGMKKFYGFHDASEDVSAFLKRSIVPPTEKLLPCQRSASSRFPGHFIAGTALRHRVNVAGSDIADASAIAPAECHPQAYLDATTVPFFVIPGGPFGNIAVGDIAIILATVAGEERLVYGVIGDSGPTGSFGEASVALLQLMRKNTLSPVMNNKALNSWSLDGQFAATILLLGNTRHLIGDKFTREAIEAAGKQALATWNGGNVQLTTRLKACSKQAPVNKGRN